MGGAKGGAWRLNWPCGASSRLSRPAIDHGHGAHRRAGRRCGQSLDPHPGPLGSRTERHGLHFECTGSVREEYPSGPCWGFACLPHARQRADAAHHRPHAGRAGHLECVDSRGGCAGQPARRSLQGNRALARSLPDLQRRRAWRAFAQADSCAAGAGARRPKRPRASWSSRRGEHRFGQRHGDRARYSRIARRRSSPTWSSPSPISRCAARRRAAP